MWMIMLELAPTTGVAALVGIGIVATSLMGVPNGVTGIPLTVPALLTGATLAAVALLPVAPER